jgi:hypothetical protein
MAVQYEIVEHPWGMKSFLGSDFYKTHAIEGWTIHSWQCIANVSLNGCVIVLLEREVFDEDLQTT